MCALRMYTYVDVRILYCTVRPGDAVRREANAMRIGSRQDNWRNPELS